MAIYSLISLTSLISLISLTSLTSPPLHLVSAQEVDEAADPTGKMSSSTTNSPSSVNEPSTATTVEGVETTEPDEVMNGESVKANAHVGVGGGGAVVGEAKHVGGVGVGHAGVGAVGVGGVVSQMAEEFITLKESIAAKVKDIDCDSFRFPIDSFDHEDPNKVYLGIQKMKDGIFKDVGLSKYLSIFGVRVIGHKSVNDDKLKYVGALLAQMLDKDNDGYVDLPRMQEQLIERFASMVIVADETFTNFLLSEDDGEGLPTELKFCPFSIDYEETAKILPGTGPEESCPEDLFNKDRAVAFVTDHIIGRSWPMLLADHPDQTPEDVENSDTYTELIKLYQSAITAKHFNLANTGCLELTQLDNDTPSSSATTHTANSAPTEETHDVAETQRCGVVMLVSWLSSTLMGVDRCYCDAVGALSSCGREEALKQMPALSAFVSKHVLHDRTHLGGVYAPDAKDVVVDDD